MKIELKVTHTGSPELLKALDKIALSLQMLKFPRNCKAAEPTGAAVPGSKAEARAHERAAKRGAKKAAVEAEETPKAETKKPPKEKPKADPVEAEVVEKEEPAPATEERTEAEVTAKARGLIAVSNPAVLRSVLDEVIGEGVKISGAPKEKFAALYAAIEAKTKEVS